MPGEVTLGQQWSVWVPNRGQWLLATVIRLKGREVVLQFDSRYGIASNYDEHKADETAMLENTSLFRLVGDPPV